MAKPKILNNILKNQSFVVKSPSKHTEEKAALLDAFFNNFQQYLVLLNKQLEIVAFNDCAFNFHHGYDTMQLKKSNSILEYINPTLRGDFEIQCKKGLRGEQVEYEHFINGGWFDFTITALKDQNNEITGLSIVGNNVNNQKRTEKLIRQQSECLSNIAWFQSHQVRSPVSSILAVMNLIREETDDNKLKEYLQLLEISTKQLDDVIKAIVHQSRSV